MAQRQNASCQETLSFGKADVYIAPLTSEDCIAPEIVSTEPIVQNERRIVNYGPCVVCKVNKACILFIGCNHLACCGQCSENCGNFCPFPNCSQPIIERLRVFEPM